VHHDDLASASRGSAKASAQRNAAVRSEAADEWADEQHAGVRWIDEIEADPVVARHFFVEMLGNMLHERLGCGSGGGESLKVLEEFFVSGHEFVTSFELRCRWFPVPRGLVSIIAPIERDARRSWRESQLSCGATWEWGLASGLFG